MSIVVVLVVVGTNIASLGDLGIWGKHLSELAKIQFIVCLESFGTAHKYHK